MGIGAGYVSGIDISHNEVCHLNYSGICVGWGWTSLESGMKNNRIEANYVHHFARRLYDAGGLYTLPMTGPFIFIWMKLRTDIRLKTTGVRLNVSTRIVPAIGMYGKITDHK